MGNGFKQFPKSLVKGASKNRPEYCKANIKIGRKWS